MLDLEMKIHQCVKCKKQGFSDILPYPPVCSFGKPEGKAILVIGQNPSGKEYESGFLSQDVDIEKRRQSQLNYFERRNYLFFDELERFFEGAAKEKIGWTKSPWERIGYLDIVKCPTKALNGQGQWSKIPRKTQEMIVRNCQGYLMEQLDVYKPKAIVAYGADVGRWFSCLLNVAYEDFEDRVGKLAESKVNVLFISQRQGRHSKPEVIWVREKIVKILNV